MPAEVWIGAGGAVLMAAAGFVRAKAGRKRVGVAAGVLVLLGWTVVGQFLLKPLVPGPVLAAVLLGGITLGIILTAVIGGRGGRAKRADPRDPAEK